MSFITVFLKNSGNASCLEGLYFSEKLPISSDTWKTYVCDSLWSKRHWCVLNFYRDFHLHFPFAFEKLNIKKILK